MRSTGADFFELGTKQAWKPILSGQRLLLLLRPSVAKNANICFLLPNQLLEVQNASTKAAPSAIGLNLHVISYCFYAGTYMFGKSKKCDMISMLVSRSAYIIQVYYQFVLFLLALLSRVDSPTSLIFCQWRWIVALCKLVYSLFSACSYALNEGHLQV
ncbi:hypothetical protein BX070DRAFT_109899 [Coemansia spiralis]|nr:hypothetical protein BX070DRAFT_109899 [Coemansia spiralis]